MRDEQKRNSGVVPPKDPTPYRFRSLEDAEKFLSMPTHLGQPNPEKDKLHVWPYIQSPENPAKIIHNPEYATAPYEMAITYASSAPRKVTIKPKRGRQAGKARFTQRNT